MDLNGQKIIVYVLELELFALTNKIELIHLSHFNNIVILRRTNCCSSVVFQNILYHTKSIENQNHDVWQEEQQEEI